MENIDVAELLAAMVAVLGTVAAIWKGVDAWRRLTGAEKREAEQTRLRQTLRDLDGRLSGCEERLRRGDSDMVQLLTALNAMLMHFISGNDHEKLKGVKESLDIYLSVR